MPAGVEEIVEDLNHISMFIKAKFCLKKGDDLVHTLGVAFESVAEVLRHLLAKVGGLVEGVG